MKNNSLYDEMLTRYLNQAITYHSHKVFVYTKFIFDFGVISIFNETFAQRVIGKLKNKNKNNNLYVHVVRAHINMQQYPYMEFKNGSDQISI